MVGSDDVVIGLSRLNLEDDVIVRLVYDLYGGHSLALFLVLSEDHCIRWIQSHVLSPVLFLLCFARLIHFLIIY